MLLIQDEIKQLETLKELRKLHPVEVVPTFMDAHEIPLEYKEGKDEYIELLINKILPEVKEKNLAEFFDVFCDKAFITDYSVVDRTFNHVKLRFIADKAPPPHVASQEVLKAAETGSEYFS